MISINCIAIDDEPPALRQIEDYISKVPYLKLKAVFSNPLDLLNFLKDEQIDLIFLDIQMENLSGIELIGLLKTKPMIILTTAFDSYAIEAFDLNVDDYLLKPISFERFLKATEKIYNKVMQQGISASELSSVQSNEVNYFFVKTEFQIKKIDFDDILYIEGLKEYLIINTVHEKVFTLQTFNEILHSLPKSDFVRVHKSYIVSLKNINSIRKNRILIGEKQIPIGNTYKELFLHSIKNLPKQ